MAGFQPFEAMAALAHTCFTSAHASILDNEYTLLSMVFEKGVSIAVFPTLVVLGSEVVSLEILHSADHFSTDFLMPC